ncbi:DUF397 domain-containing protein [Streptomyces sp. NPDC002577]
MPTQQGPDWFTSSYSGGSGNECVQCAHTGTGMLVRDSKLPDGPRIEISAEAWTQFLAVAHGIRPS